MARRSMLVLWMLVCAAVAAACGGSESPPASGKDAAAAPAAQSVQGERKGPHLDNRSHEQPPLKDIGPGGWGRNVEQVAHNDLGRRGMNSAVALTRSGCAYVGSRNGTQGIAVLDIADPRGPTLVREVGLRPGSTSRELRVVEDLDLLVVEYYALEAKAPNILAFFDISDCRLPIWVDEFNFREFSPHEFFAWRDPSDPRRLLLYVSRAPYLDVIDATNVRSTGPVHVASFHLRQAKPGPRPDLHSMSVSDDGTRVYMADLQEGYFVLDATPLAGALPCDAEDLEPNPCLRKLNPDYISTLVPDGESFHSIVPVPGPREDGHAYAVTAEEVGRPSSCPWAWARILDVTEGTEPQRSAPVEVATFRVPENLLRNCEESYAKVLNLESPQPGGRFTSHNPTVLRNLVLHTWYAGGLRVYDISRPARPLEVGVFFPAPVRGTTFVSKDDENQVSLWSYPVIMDGLIYVAGINEGLLVLRYTGPGHEEIDGIVGPCQSNLSPIESIGTLQGYCFR